MIPKIHPRLGVTQNFLKIFFDDRLNTEFTDFGATRGFKNTLLPNTDDSGSIHLREHFERFALHYLFHVPFQFTFNTFLSLHFKSSFDDKLRYNYFTYEYQILRVTLLGCYFISLLVKRLSGTPLHIALPLWSQPSARYSGRIKSIPSVPSHVFCGHS